MKRLGIYYYHEKKQKWIYLGGKVHGNTLTVSLINHNINFNKLAVLEDRTYPGFTDIVGEDMSADLVKVLTLGIIKGYEDLTLRLDQTMSREEWITAFILALDTPLKEGEDDLSFEEVSPWAQAYIRTALALELIGDTSVRGHERLMAKEAVEMLDKAVSRMAELEEKKVFRLEEEIEGDPLLTRRQAVQLLAQLLKYLYV
nr:S-layer homology domain-containing protein [Anaerosolibacter carboniphilus]